MLKLVCLNKAIKKARRIKDISDGLYSATCYFVLVKPSHVAEILAMG